MTPKRNHWLRIVRRYDKIIADIEQIIIDAEYWNGLPHNRQYTPLDVEADRLLLHRVRRDRREFIAANPEPV